MIEKGPFERSHIERAFHRWYRSPTAKKLEAQLHGKSLDDEIVKAVAKEAFRQGWSARAAKEEVPLLSPEDEAD